MAKGQIPDENVKVAAFAKAELDVLVESLSTQYAALQVTDMALMSALILGATRSPPETLAALLETYWRRHTEQRAIAAATEFIQAYSGEALLIRPLAMPEGG